MPPIANHGRSPPRAAAWRTYSSPAAGRPGLVGVSQTGPTLSWSASDPSAASNCSGEWVDRPIRSCSPTCSRTSPAGVSSWPTWMPSAPAAQGEVGPVVQPEERALLIGRRRESARPPRAESRRRAPCRGAAPCRPRRGAPGREHMLRGGVHDEVEPGSPQALARVGEPHVSRRVRRRRRQRDRRAPGRFTLPRFCAVPAPAGRCSCGYALPARRQPARG